MDPVLASFLTSLLAAIASAVPGLLAAWTGKPDDKAAIEHMLAVMRALPEREASGGDSAAGRWDHDVDARRAGGLASTEPPPSPYGDP